MALCDVFAVVLVDQATRHHGLLKGKTALETLTAIMDYGAYQPLAECFRSNEICSKRPTMGKSSPT